MNNRIQMYKWNCWLDELVFRLMCELRVGKGKKTTRKKADFERFFLPNHSWGKNNFRVSWREERFLLFSTFKSSIFLSMHSIIFFSIYATHSAPAECAELLEATEQENDRNLSSLLFEQKSITSDKWYLVSCNWKWLLVLFAISLSWSRSAFRPKCNINAKTILGIS